MVAKTLFILFMLHMYGQHQQSINQSVNQSINQSEFVPLPPLDAFPPSSPFISYSIPSDSSGSAFCKLKIMLLVTQNQL